MTSPLVKHCYFPTAFTVPLLQTAQRRRKGSHDGSVFPPDAKAGKPLVTLIPGRGVTASSPSSPYCFIATRAQQGRVFRGYVIPHSRPQFTHGSELQITWKKLMSWSSFSPRQNPPQRFECNAPTFPSEVQNILQLRVRRTTVLLD